MNRALEKYIRKDLKRKIILITGPRQTEKTTLANMLSPNYDYFNYDSAEYRLSLMEKSWDRSKAFVILDEHHKMKKMLCSSFLTNSTFNPFKLLFAYFDAIYKKLFLNYVWFQVKGNIECKKLILQKQTHG